MKKNKTKSQIIKEHCKKNKIPCKELKLSKNKFKPDDLNGFPQWIDKITAIPLEVQKAITSLFIHEIKNDIFRKKYNLPKGYTIIGLFEGEIIKIKKP